MARGSDRWTLLVVPQGSAGRATRSYELSARALRALAVVLVVAALAWAGMALSWLWFFAQAARVDGLQRQVALLEAEQQRVAELATELAEVEKRYQQVRRMLGADGNADSAGVWLPPAGEAADEPPLANGAAAQRPSAWPLTQRGFITREHLGRIPGQHPGIDIAVAEGAYVRAATAGVVTEAGEDPVYGRYVRLQHGGGYQSLYGHASRLFVERGDRVDRNEVIALSGNTGTSTAPHLHFEIWKDGEPIDPRTLVEQP